MSRCFIGLGSNRGNSSQAFDMALKTLDSHPHISLVNTSPFYRSDAMGAGAGADFLNAVAECETNLSADEVLTQLQTLEKQAGRIEKGTWGPRALDLDLLYRDDDVSETDDLTLPHVGAWYRRFILMPMCDIAADFRHPVYHETQAELLARIDARPLTIQLIGCDIFSGNIGDLANEFAEVTFESPLLPDPSEGLIVVGRKSEGLKTDVAQVDLSQLPGNNLDALKSVLQAVIGNCEKA
ncbi:MAG: 2-amino-4-hydroxy-6-hydroxymethyldihydropteridine diphosphokinase [Planctomycetaceae bacterium]|jgi:2-amino-4-hydroxy-6-hydroxymethyldihydropteridine diphosphokinase|nr:2-amino-4-hydroxy-6-hydroxymethyldihydropteridine diphosphokinase [Planctomycetaceae bacterium]MDG2390992.1 2-amino-4-hydroxy-6-hydroxymethyldihydropteridine diphosphokinase [Planctomycetaceae bacterium]